MKTEMRINPKYEEWTKQALLEKAKESGIENYHMMSKMELIYSLIKNEKFTAKNGETT